LARLRGDSQHFLPFICLSVQNWAARPPLLPAGQPEKSFFMTCFSLYPSCCGKSRKSALFLRAAGLAAAIALPALTFTARPARPAIDLSGNPYIKAAPYRPPPLPLAPPAPQTGGKAAARPRFEPPGVHYRPAPLSSPARAANHRQWCQRNHPSYRAADNSYRPFDKSSARLPARLPCVSPYSRP